MSRDAKSPDQVNAQETTTEAPATSPRRAYRAPQLRRLGSVRSLTLGSPRLPNMDGLPGGMMA